MATTSTDSCRRDLAASYMPTDSPRMEYGGTKDSYQVLLSGLDANATVLKSCL